MFKTTRKKARTLILNFANKYAGKEIETDKLNDKDLYSASLAECYLRIDALLGYDSDVCTTLDRAIEYAERQKAENYKTFKADHKIISILAEGEHVDA